MTNLPCDCCEGPSALTPLSVVNRPGLSVLKYRVGTYATFFGTMRSRLSAKEFPELASLRTRESADPSMALLDAWASVGDVLTFYQERIANEGYLRTATERRSILELARLVGYSLRPGVAATTYLAYTIDKDTGPAEVGKGARVNSIPAPGEQMQAFELSEPLTARPEWSELKPRMTQRQTEESINEKGLHLEGTGHNLKKGDPFLLRTSKGLEFNRIGEVTLDNANNRTTVTFVKKDQKAEALDRFKATRKKFARPEQFNVSPSSAVVRRVSQAIDEASEVADLSPEALAVHLEERALPKIADELRIAKRESPVEVQGWIENVLKELSNILDQLTGRVSTGTPSGGAADRKDVLANVVEALKGAPKLPPMSPQQLSRTVGSAFGGNSDNLPRLLMVLQPKLKQNLYAALNNLTTGTPTEVEAYALRVIAAPFGHNAPLLAKVDAGKAPIFDEWDVDNPFNADSDEPRPDHHLPGTLYLDSEYDIAPDSIIVVENQHENYSRIVEKPINIIHRSLAAYGLSGKTIQIDLPAEANDWLRSPKLTSVRNTRVYAGTENLPLSLEPLTEDIKGTEIQLNGMYDGLDAGRMIIVTGERTDVKRSDIKAITGLIAGEPAMIASVSPVPESAEGGTGNGNTFRTTITLAAPGLKNTYRRDTVTIYCNITKATHGETRQEVLGSGDPTKPFQSFQLKVPGLTHVPAPTASGVQSTLQVWVNGVQWHEAASLAELGPMDRKFITQTNNQGITTVTFGDGEHGARPPAGVENITATYRSGIGGTGNLKGGQISLVATRPLGVKAVSNPIEASGGADRESRDQARHNTPIALVALDRLVSISDYADFARTFAGIAKASAEQMQGGRAQVKVTVAAANDNPLDESSELLRNLREAFQRLGDPRLPISIVPRERLAQVMSVRVKVRPDYLWEKLEPIVRAALLDAFGFERIQLGDDLFLSDAMKVVQALPGVVYVDVDTFDVISEDSLLKGFTSSQTLDLKRRERIATSSSQLAYLTPEVPDALILQEIKP